MIIRVFRATPKTGKADELAARGEYRVRNYLQQQSVNKAPIKPDDSMNHQKYDFCGAAGAPPSPLAASSPSAQATVGASVLIATTPTMSARANQM